MCSVNLKNLLEFLHLVGKLKHVKRTGWVKRNIKEPESVAGHMYRMGMLTFLLDGKDGLDTMRCMKLSLVHDLAESIVGDLTPYCGVEPAEKHRREREAMKEIAALAGSAGKELLELFEEYEDQKTVESKTVHELDAFDMILQAFEYEKEENRPHDLQEFFDSTRNRFSHPLVASLVMELANKRRRFEESARMEKINQLKLKPK